MLKTFFDSHFAIVVPRPVFCFAVVYMYKSVILDDAVDAKCLRILCHLQWGMPFHGNIKCPAIHVVGRGSPIDPFVVIGGAVAAVYSHLSAEMAAYFLQFALHEPGINYYFV